MENVKITTDHSTYGIIYSDLQNIEITLRNVEHTGSKLVTIPHSKLILDDKVTSYSSAQFVYHGSNLEILPNAEVNFELYGDNKFCVLYMQDDNSSLKIGAEAQLSLAGGYSTIRGRNNFTLVNNGIVNVGSGDAAIRIEGDNSTYTFKEGSSFKSILPIYGHDIHVKKGANFELKTSDKSPIVVEKSLVFDDGSNFSIETSSPKDVIIKPGGYDREVPIQLHSSSGIDTWNKDDIAVPPTKSYSNPIDATFTLTFKYPIEQFSNTI